MINAKKVGVFYIFCCLAVSNASAFMPPRKIDNHGNSKKKTALKRKGKKAKVEKISSFRSNITNDVSSNVDNAVNSSVRNTERPLTVNTINSFTRCHMNFAYIFPGRRIRLSNYAPIYYDNNGQEILSEDPPPTSP